MARKMIDIDKIVSGVIDGDQLQINALKDISIEKGRKVGTELQWAFNGENLLVSMLVLMVKKGYFNEKIELTDYLFLKLNRLLEEEVRREVVSLLE